MYRMVIADDEYIVVEGIKAIIRRLNLDCEVVGSALNGIEALDVVRETRPDLVITDIRMPGLDGLSLIESCRDFLPEAFYVVISGYTEFEYARRALKLGVISYIDKPVTMQKISEVIAIMDQKNQRPSVVREQIETKMDDLLDVLIREQPQELQEAVEGILLLLRNSVSKFDRYIQEIFKLCAVLAEVYNDLNRSGSEFLRVSYQELEGFKHRQEAEDYVARMIGKIKENMSGRKVGSRHRVVKQMIRSIEERYQENIGLNEFALMVNMNPAYLSILFREEVGISYVKYLTDYRIQKAKEFLDQGMKVVEVSEKVGYLNYRYFCEIFKKREGQTPNEYKGRVRKGN